MIEFQQIKSYQLRQKTARTWLYFRMQNPSQWSQMKVGSTTIFFHVIRATGILQFRIPNFTSKFPNVTVTSEKKKNLTPKNWQQKLNFSNSNTARTFKPIPEQITSASTKTWVWWSKRSQHSWIYLLPSQPDQQRWQWKFHGQQSQSIPDRRSVMSAMLLGRGSLGLQDRHLRIVGLFQR